jgi:chromosome segregation ATPase
MGVFNDVKQLADPGNVSKARFDINLSNYATRQQFKELLKEMSGYLHRNKELDNKMNRPLDMGGNSIINVGDIDKPNDAVSKRYVYLRMQDIIKDYNLEDIQSIKDTLKNTVSQIAELTKDLQNNEKAIIDLQDKIKKEIELLGQTLSRLSEEEAKDDEILAAFKTSMATLQEQMTELHSSMVKHEELKEKVEQTVRRLQNAYQIEIRAEINKLNAENKQRNDDLLNNFLEKFAEYKAELEKSASQRGDGHDQTIDSLRKQIDDIIKENIQRQCWQLVTCLK